MAKNLPTFSGNPLEWFNFKEAYELSLEPGGYSDRENIARLFEASRNASTVMRTLELHFGNKKLVAEKTVSEIKNLPSIGSEKTTLAQFSTKVKDASVAFKTFNLVGYLHSPELVPQPKPPRNRN